MTPEESAPRWSLGRLAPGVMLLALVLDVASRFLSYDAFCFREWEAMTRFRVFELGGPFEPNKQYRNPRTYGGIAAMGNLPRLREYRPIVFSSDSYGFRVTAAPNQGAPQILLVGSSFSAGATLSDDETFAAQLMRASGETVYNAAGADLSDARQLRRLLSRLDLRPGGVVVHEYVDGSGPLDARSIRDTENAPLRATARRLLGARYDQLLRAHARFDGWASDSPLRLSLFKTFKLIEDDRVLPNSFADNVYEDLLLNGDSVVFLREQLELRKRHDVEKAARYWQAMQRRLAAQGLSQLVVLVPNQYTVYGPLTHHPPSKSTEDYLAALESALRQAEIPTLNLTSLLRAVAAEGLASKRYVYWRDDTHWNPAGAKVAAGEVARAIAALRASAAQ